MTVTKAPLVITASSPTVTYHSAVPSITASFSGFVNGESKTALTTAPSCKTSYTTTSAVGTSPSTTCSGAAGANYSITYIAGSVSIQQATQTITMGSTAASLSYSAAPITLSGTATSALGLTFVGTPGICNASGNTLTIVGGGSCVVTANQAGNANYLPAMAVTRTITITPVALTITASSSAVVFGAPVPVINASFTGFVKSDTASSLTTAPTCSTTYTPVSPAGTFPVTSCQGAVSPNYAIKYVAGKVTITPAPQPVTAAPVISILSGTYTAAQSVTLSDATSGAVIYYTVDGSQPTAASPAYTGTITVGTSLTLKAIAIAGGCTVSATSTATYTITPASIDFSAGFTPLGGMQLNGKSALSGTRLQLTDGGANEAASAFFSTPMNVATFTTSFTIQQGSGTGDGMTFVIQNAASGPKAIGPGGSSLGYSYGPTQAGAILNSLAIKFDLYSNAGESPNSTGLYVSGTRPTTPAVDLTPSAIDLHSGHAMNVQLTYDGTTLQLKITDASTAKSYSTSWPVNIPQLVGGSTAYVGFTAGTGGATAIQQVLNWKF